MTPSPLQRLRRGARQLGARAVGELLASDAGAGAAGDVVKRLQAARVSLDDGSARMMAALGLATKADLDRVSRKIGRLRKRMLALLERVRG
jgi:hypothetical protein